MLTGGMGALIAGLALCCGLAQAMGAQRGTEPRLEFEAALNAWKLPILFVPAGRLHLARKARRGGERGRRAPPPAPGQRGSGSGGGVPR